MQSERPGRAGQAATAVPVIPATDPERALWWQKLDEAIEIDLLRISMGLLAAGVRTGAVVEGVLKLHRDALASHVAGVVDRYLAELSWHADGSTP